MKCKYLLLVILLHTACKHPRKVTTSFYYWKTIYKHNTIEDSYLRRLQVHRLYMRIMDVDEGENGIVPVSPIQFSLPVTDSLQVVPVVFIVNDALRDLSKPQLHELAGKINYFVTGKLKQAHKNSFKELQIDCDWTKATKDNYFYFLKQLNRLLAIHHQSLSVTLRLHQLKNQQGSGIPPANKVLLMCYNMGNLRKYGAQNSILDVNELKQYAGRNLTHYPLPMNVGLPLFSWAVVFRQQQYAGIARRVSSSVLQDTACFVKLPTGLYQARLTLPEYGLLAGDEVRWEAADYNSLQAAAGYLSNYLKPGSFELIYFNLDAQTLKPYSYAKLQSLAHLFR